MKLSLNTDFTKLPTAERFRRAGEGTSGPAAGHVALPHDERHMRRRVLALAGGDKLLVDLPEPVALATGDRLVLDDGREIEIVAAPEELLSIVGRDAVHLAELAWHIGNRHLAAAIGPARILILRDHVIRDMLEGLGAEVTDVVEPFEPLRGAYSGHAGHDHHHHGHDHDHDHHHDHDHGHHHDHDHGHDHHHDHDHHHGHGGHSHGARDAFGRLPGDPHYGHNHG
jgi:urease accessory protein